MVRVFLGCSDKSVGRADVFRSKLKSKLVWCDERSWCNGYRKEEEGRPGHSPRKGQLQLFMNRTTASQPATSAPKRITSNLELLGKAGPVRPKPDQNKGINSFFPLALGWQRPSGPSSPVKDPCLSPPVHRNPALARPGCAFSARGASFASESSWEGSSAVGLTGVSTAALLSLNRIMKGILQV